MFSKDKKKSTLKYVYVAKKCNFQELLADKSKVHVACLSMLCRGAGIGSPTLVIITATIWRVHILSN